MSASSSSSSIQAAWPLTGREIVPRPEIKRLQRRTDRHGLAYFAGLTMTQILTGALIHLLGTSVAVVPAILLHGFVLSLWFAPMHECTHGTAFRTRALNRVVGLIAGFLIWRPPLYFKYRHAAHHTFTQHPQKDPDMVRMPRTFREYLGTALGLSAWRKLLLILVRGGSGRFTEAERSFIPAEEVNRVRNETRAFLVAYALIVATALATGHAIELVLYWILPRLVGEPLLRMIRIAEHTGAAESPNLLENTRTVLANPVLRFLFWNMPYHVEHHLVPSLPFHALPALHPGVKSRIGFLSTSYWAVHRDLWTSLRRST